MQSIHIRLIFKRGFRKRSDPRDFGVLELVSSRKPVLSEDYWDFVKNFGAAHQYTVDIQKWFARAGCPQYFYLKLQYQQAK